MRKWLGRILPLFFFFLVVLLFFLPGRLIKVRKIECSSQYGECKHEFLKKLEDLEGGNLISVKRDLKKEIGSDVSIGDFDLRFNLPDNVEVSIIEKKPKYALFNPDQKRYMNISEDGYIISFSENSELPIVTADKVFPEIGSSVAGKYKFSLDLLYDLFLTFQVKEGTFSGDSLVIEIPGNLRVIFPIEGDREALVGSFVLLYSEYQNEGNTGKSVMSDIVEIDLRYKNPVLKKKVPVTN